MHTLTSELNWYDLYRRVIPGELLLSEEERKREVVIDGETKAYKLGRTVQEYTPWI